MEGNDLGTAVLDLKALDTFGAFSVAGPGGGGLRHPRVIPRRMDELDYIVFGAGKPFIF